MEIYIETEISLLYGICLVVGYGLLGAGLKYIDETYDVGIFDKRKALAVSIASGLLMGTLMAVDTSSAIILFGIIISVGAAGKIDNLAFYIVMFLSIIILLTSTLITSSYGLHMAWLVPLGYIVLSGIGDELLDTIGHRKKIKALEMRPIMKVIVLLLCIFGIFDFVYFIAFLAFDLAYLCVALYSHKLVRSMSPLERERRNIVTDEI